MFLSEEFDLPQIDAVCSELFDFLIKSNLKIWRVEAPMGGGKTTTTSHLLQKMNIEDQVSSPTFSLVNEYFSADYGTIYHFDFYRIDDIEEAFDIGAEDYFYSGNWCFIEWSEKIEEILPEDLGTIEIKVTDDNKRIIKAFTNG